MAPPWDKTPYAESDLEPVILTDYTNTPARRDVRLSWIGKTSRDLEEFFQFPSPALVIAHDGKEKGVRKETRSSELDQRTRRSRFDRHSISSCRSAPSHRGACKPKMSKSARRVPASLDFVRGGGAEPAGHIHRCERLETAGRGPRDPTTAGPNIFRALNHRISGPGAHIPRP
jgi:hypothetical protein